MIVTQERVVDVRTLSESEFRAIVLTHLSMIFQTLKEIHNAASNGTRPIDGSYANADAVGCSLTLGTPGPPGTGNAASPESESGGSTEATPPLIVAPRAAC